MSDIPSDWFDGYFEEEWLDEIALHIPEERTRKEIDFVLERLELEPGARVLDVACGHGRHSLELARRGFRVTGVDLSPRSIELAREAAASEGLDDATFVERDARELDFDGGFDGAINLFTSVLGYFDEEAENRRVVEAVARALRPGGSFLVDTINLLSLARGFQELHWEEFTSGTLMVEHRAFDFRARPQPRRLDVREPRRKPQDDPPLAARLRPARADRDARGRGPRRRRPLGQLRR